MLDLPAPRPEPALPAMQRAQGRAAVSLKAVAARAMLNALRQEGSAKAILPRTDGALPEVVFLNTAGGLTGGDRIDYALALAPGLAAVATTQTAERAYASSGGEARMSVRLDVGAGGWLDWLPQETILFDGAALDRDTVIDLGPEAGCLMVETVILGRHAMGETLRGLSFRDSRMIRRDGVPIWVEPLILDTRALSRAAGPAMLGGARGLSTLVLVHPRAGDLIGPLRAVLDEDGVEAAASAFDGRLVLRALARDGLPLRRQVLRALAALRPYLPSAGPLPRVWGQP